MARGKSKFESSNRAAADLEFMRSQDSHVYFSPHFFNPKSIDPNSRALG